MDLGLDRLDHFVLITRERRWVQGRDVSGELHKGVAAYSSGWLDCLRSGCCFKTGMVSRDFICSEVCSCCCVPGTASFCIEFLLRADVDLGLQHPRHRFCRPLHRYHHHPGLHPLILITMTIIRNHPHNS